MRLSIKEQLFRYLRDNPGWTAKGELERKVWLKKNGKAATPDNIGRRLRELAEEKRLKVEQRSNHDWYAINTATLPPKIVLVEETYIDQQGVERSHWVRRLVAPTTGNC